LPAQPVGWRMVSASISLIKGVNTPALLEVAGPTAATPCKMVTEAAAPRVSSVNGLLNGIGMLFLLAI